MPTVTVRSRPNGLPMAMAHWPVRSLSESPSSAARQRARARVDLDDREIGLRVAPHEGRRELAVVGQPHLDVGRVLHDVGVGQDVAARVDDDARARRARLLARRAALEEAVVELGAEEVAEALLAFGRLRPPSPAGAFLALTLTLTTDGVTRSATEAKASSSAWRMAVLSGALAAASPGLGSSRLRDEPERSQQHPRGQQPLPRQSPCPLLARHLTLPPHASPEEIEVSLRGYAASPARSGRPARAGARQPR